MVRGALQNVEPDRDFMDREFDEAYGGCFRASGLPDESFVQQQPMFRSEPFEPQFMGLNDVRQFLAHHRPKDFFTCMELKVAQVGTGSDSSESVCCTIAVGGKIVQADSWEHAIELALAVVSRRSA